MGISLLTNVVTGINLPFLVVLILLKSKIGSGKKVHRSFNVDIIYSVVTRLELQRLKTEITKIDPEAFVVENSVKDIKGGMIKKRPYSGIKFSALI